MRARQSDERTVVHNRPQQNEEDDGDSMSSLNATRMLIAVVPFLA